MTKSPFSFPSLGVLRSQGGADLKALQRARCEGPSRNCAPAEIRSLGPARPSPVLPQPQPQPQGPKTSSRLLALNSGWARLTLSSEPGTPGLMLRKLQETFEAVKIKTSWESSQFHGREVSLAQRKETKRRKQESGPYLRPPHAPSPTGWPQRCSLSW